MKPDLLIRVAARSEPTETDPGRVHVIFARTTDGKRPDHYRETWGYYMHRDTYRAIPYGVDASPLDYAAHGMLTAAPADIQWRQPAPEVPAPEVRVVDLDTRLAEARAQLAALDSQNTGRGIA